LPLSALELIDATAVTRGDTKLSRDEDATIQGIDDIGGRINSAGATDDGIQWIFGVASGAPRIPELFEHVE